MDKIRRTKQRGSIIPFMAVTVILTIALIGGIYTLKQRGEQARREQAIAVVDKQIASDSAQKANDNTVSPEINNESVSAPTFTDEAATETQNLPVTGPRLVVGELFGAGLLAYSVVIYAKSRRSFVRSL